MEVEMAGARMAGGFLRLLVGREHFIDERRSGGASLNCLLLPLVRTLAFAANPCLCVARESCIVGE